MAGTLKPWEVARQRKPWEVAREAARQAFTPEGPPQQLPPDLGTPFIPPANDDPISRVTGKMLDEVLAKIEGGLEVDKVASALPGSTVKFAKDTVTGLDPRVFGPSIMRVISGAVSAAMPGQQADEEVMGQIGQALQDAYGSVEAIEQTLETDPVRVVGDLATILSGGSLAPVRGAATAGKIGRTIDPINLAVQGAKAPLAGLQFLPGINPTSLLNSSVKFRPGLGRQTREQLIKTMLDEKILPNSGGLDKAQQLASDLNQQIDEIVARAANAGDQIPVDQIRTELQRTRNRFDNIGSTRAGDLSAMDGIIEAFEASLDGRSAVSPVELAQLKTNLQGRINFDAPRGSITEVQQAGLKAQASGARQSLEGLSPEVGPVNQRLGNLIELQDELTPKVNVLENRNPLGLPQLGSAGVGAALGMPEAGIALGIATMPGVQSRIAMYTQRLIDIGMDPQRARALAPTLVTQAATQIGRQENE